MKVLSNVIPAVLQFLQWPRCLLPLLLFFPVLLPAADLQISEFMAVNDATIPDEDGEFSDWIELHNAGTNVVNLDGWYLTDRVGDLTQWRFPATNLPPNGYLIVFASGKDRKVPGAPLHTNFKLSSDGEYLALIAPGGTNVVSAYSPFFPVQIGGVSYGLGQGQTTTTLVPEGATAKLLVPGNGVLGQSWTLPSFNDGGWTTVTTGVGFERDGRVPFVPTTIADSVAEFTGTQGANNWSYGYWNRSADADQTYGAPDFTPFPNSGGAYGANNYWNGTSWNWFNGDPPYTELSAAGGRPSVSTAPNQPDHWAIRRYVSEFDGPIQVTGLVTHTSDWVRVTQTATFPSGVTPLLYIYLTGVGEGYLDDVVVVAGDVPEAGANLVVNGDFESPNFTTRWTVSPNLAGSDATTANPHGGNRSLHIVSSGGGSSQTTAIWQNVAGFSVGQTYTLSYWYLPLTNSDPLVVRFSGSWINTSPEYCGSGVIGRIFVDGREVFQQPAFVSSESYDVTFPVHLGSKVDFAIDPGFTTDNACHGASFTARVRTADPTLAVVADSVADWSVTGAQGEKGWYYGYWNAGTNVPPPTYRQTNFTAFPRATGPFSTNNFWDGAKWDWWNGDPPTDEITQTEMNPNGLNNGPIHWVLRRWISDVSGDVTVDWTLIKPEATGGGVSARVLLNGVQRDGVTLPGTNSPVVRRSVLLSGVRIGDTIDLALDPTGIGGTYGDGGDRCRLSMTIRGHPSLTSSLATDVETTLWDAGNSAYLRIPFTITEPASIEFLALQMKYDDGFVAYLNGQRVASANAPADPQFNSTALQARSDADALTFEDFDLTAWRGLLLPGTNVLAIHGMNVRVDDNDFLILPRLVATRVDAVTSSGRYFTEPTPGAANGSGTIALGPVIRDVQHEPQVPTDAQDLKVTARLQATLAPVGAVQLAYRVMFSNEVVLSMRDDGQNGDSAAGDGVYTATIPASAAGPGQMLRYYVFASDNGTNRTRFPAFEDPQGAPEYLGTVVRDPSVTSALPVLQIFVRNPTLATNFTGTRCSIFYDDEFYDNVGINLHGQTTAFVFVKRSMNIDLNRGYKLRWNKDESRVNDFNLLSPIADKAYVRQLLAYETFTRAGVPTHFAFAVRVQQNGAFFGLYHFVEKGDDNWLQRVGLDPEGSLYKVYLPLTNAPYGGAVEKKTRQNEPNDDLAMLSQGLDQSGQGLERFIFDNVDIPEAVNFLATLQLVQNEDCCYFKNYYLYRDTRGSGEWKIMPWDLDLTFGRTFGFFDVNGQTINGYYNTNIYWTNAYYTQRRSIYDYIGVGQPLINSILINDRTFTMFLRRWSAVHDQFLQPTNTHPLLNFYERRVDELIAQLGPDAELDFARWGNWAPTQTLATAVQVLKTEYFARRRGWVFNTLRYTNDGPYLNPVPTNLVLRLGAIEFNPASGNQAEEYIEVINPYSTPVDISGWRMSGGIDYTFRSGVVIPAGDSLYLSPDVNAFRKRGTGPRGGQGLFVQGPYQRQLSAWGEMLLLSDANGRHVYATNYPGSPSLAQQFLRITELMYHPAPPPPGLATNADAFAYIELRNIGPVSLDLSHVRFTAGIEFDFTGSTVTTLGSGQTVLVVKNRAAFTSRYGGGLPVAGEFTGSLDHGGETLRLEDAKGEKILEFAYSNSWYPLTDGAGFSLVIQDDEVGWESWGEKENWRASSAERGSPGQNEPQPPAIAGLLINEALTRTEPPAVDTVELYNPTASQVNLRGWFLSDDFGTPKKYRISTDVFVPAGGYRLFSEADFNAAPGSPTSFAFSSLGDEVYLFSGDANTNLTGYVDGFRFGAAETGSSFGRYRNSVGEQHFVAQISYTPGALNSGPRLGPVVVSEIHFHPPERVLNQDNTDDEFIALRNIANGAVNLFDAVQPGNTWQVRGAVDFSFPPNVTLPPNGTLLLVSFSPADAAALAAFRARFAVPAGVTVLGPYSGKLDNSGEALELYRPAAPDPGTSIVPFILVERIAYRDSAPWPTGADGTGASLQRRVLNAYGDDPANWRVGTPAAGATSPTGAPPLVTTQPANQTGLLSQSATFSVTATGLAPLRYQWMHNDEFIPGATNAAVTISPLRFEDAGTYAATVYNNAGVTVSSNASLNILLPAYVLTRPQPVRLRGSTNAADYGFTTNNANFSVVAAGNGAIRYQWRFNGNPIPGATGPNLTVPNATLANDGSYDVLITDDVGTIPSPTARLTVLLSPQLLLLPLPQTVVSNGSFTAAVVIRGNPPPFYYTWFEVSAPRGNFRDDARTNFFTSGPITNLASRNWRVIVTNEANLAATANTQFPVIALADTDRDGLPDEWETRYGLEPGDPSDRNLDLDGDGASNLEEFLAGTDPTSGQNHLSIDSLALSNGALITFSMESNRTYSVQYKDDVSALGWTKLADVLATRTNGVGSVTDPNFVPTRFYRLVTPRQP